MVFDESITPQVHSNLGLELGEIIISSLVKLRVLSLAAEGIRTETEDASSDGCTISQEEVLPMRSEM